MPGKSRADKPCDPRDQRRYKTIAREVIRQEPRCWLRLTGCTTHSTQADHVITVTECKRLGRPDLITDRANMHGACAWCNRQRSNKPIDSIRHLLGAADRQPDAVTRFFG